MADCIKECTSCHEVKSNSDFNPNQRGKYGTRSKCKPCNVKRAQKWNSNNRDAYYQRTYGLTLSEYAEMVKRQNGLCAVCGNPPDGTLRNVRLIVDHCHETGRIRGLLCRYCNMGIGLLGDSTKLVAAALAYLEGGQ